MENSNFSSDYNVTLDNIDEISSDFNLTEFFLDLEKKSQGMLLKYYIIPIGLGMVFVVGIIGNISLLMIIVTRREMYTIPNLMLLNIAVCDSLSLIINTIGNYIATFVLETWIFNSVCCKVVLVIRNLVICVSVYSVMVVGVQRFLASTQFSRRPVFNTKRKQKIALMVCLLWFGCLLLVSPHCYEGGIYDGKCMEGIIYNQTNFTRAYTLFELAFIYVIPVTVTAVFTMLAARRLKESVRNVPAVGHDQIRRARTMTSCVLVVLIFLFALSYGPLYIVVAIYVWSKREILHSMFFIQASVVAYSLIFLYPCLNPIALYIVSKKYREYFNMYLSCCRGIQHQKANSKTSSPGTDTTLK